MFGVPIFFFLFFLPSLIECQLYSQPSSSPSFSTVANIHGYEQFEESHVLFIYFFFRLPILYMSHHQSN